MVVDVIDSFHKMQVIRVHSDPLRSRCCDWLRLAKDVLMIYISMSARDKGEERERRQESLQAVMPV